ncbi:bifunctional diaminohydroxyphosphoribosylaminopyrimidine deaminase/5-amino-6-(5-phosphoribosylamino)uracil reductase RibD [Spirosoma aerolatum]|uniref:bifunctional diaminohydroxyphosphoribosylaminopyrimidine deaminase/5-amino-6-(5-phosphoribosylamino)uracil reductase RibD n=1 Tax=Spirosoma aerolatum TaxID=1211326 RepID=UPI001FE9216C|nr:bifunctional diaminohydroxyphosphoribosylaminopyrimidine deaminase/5-amino-6-(5-phosphoribosylamino)uracil reductase RibD [Spirosoma aerolatum]
MIFGLQFMENPFMRRALELATLGRGRVSPNPMVGCVIVHDRKGEIDIPFARIIGEGWHQRYGEAHAERNAILSVRSQDAHLLPESTAYVTLEPCSHYGKQPPCADLLIERAVGRVVCCNDDPNPLVAGQGFARLRAAGIQVETGVMNEMGRQLNARFFTFFEKKRPYIILKWAETSDGFIGGEGAQPVKISGELAHRLVHRWRGEEDGIMVGTNTARNDNPRLNTRLWPGKNPVRIVWDRNLTLPADLHVFDGSQPTIVYHQRLKERNGESVVEQKADSTLFPPSYSIAQSLNNTLQDLHLQGIQSVLVEGGASLLQSFLDEGVWDEMRVFRSPRMLGNGIKAPIVQGRLVSRKQVGEDELSIYQPN